jgi:hypothetical protein
LKDQFMSIRLIRRWYALAIAASSVCALHAATVSQDFSANPALSGWQAYGDTNSFFWNPTNHNLEVTWDSRRTNSYFFVPVGQAVTRFADFPIDFDLVLQDAMSGIEPGKTTPLQVAVGFLNYADASSPDFMRGAGQAPNVAEFDYYTSGSFEWGGVVYTSDPAALPSFISGGAVRRYAPVYVYPYDLTVPTQRVVHVSMTYRGENQTAIVALTTNGVSLGTLPPLALTDRGQSQFGGCDTFLVDTFSVSSYSSNGDDYDSLLAHGTIDNVVFSTELHPQPKVNGYQTIEGCWEAQFFGRGNWLYTLQRTIDFNSWPDVAGPVLGQNTCLLLQDTNPPTGGAFYRVKAVKP